MKKQFRKSAAVVLSAAMAMMPAGTVWAEESTAGGPAKGIVQLEISETGAEILTDMAQMDMSWLKNIRLEANVNDVTETDMLSLGMKLNDVSLATLKCCLDSENSVLYGQIPELSDAFLKLNLNQLMDLCKEVYGTDLTDLSGLAGAAADTSVNEEFVMELQEEYLNPFLEVFTEEEETAGQIVYGGNTYDATFSGVSAPLTQVLDAAAADLEKLKNDSEVLDLINTYNTEEEITPEMLDELISQINSMKEEEDIAKIKLVAMYGMNEDATALGAYLGAIAEDEQLKVAELNAEMNGDKVNGAVRFGVEEESVVVDFAVDTVNGIYDCTLAAEGEGVGSIHLEIGEERGLIRLTPITDSPAAPLADLAGYSLEFTYGDQAVSANVMKDNQMLYKLTLTAADGEVIEMADYAAAEQYDVLDEEQLNSYLENVNIWNLFSALGDAGFNMDVSGE